MQITVVLFSGILLLYIIKIYRYRHSWEDSPEFRPEKSSPYIGISIIVAFRNEIDCIENLLKSLSRQIYPADAFEVILVNDHSDDGSDLLVKQFCENKKYFRCIENTGTQGKKGAIKAGVRASVHEILVTTDADCSMGESWLATISRFQCEMNADMIIGLVDIDSGGRFFEQFQEAEFLSLVASGAGAAALGKPIYCNAANLIYKKVLFTRLDDPMHEMVSSGDDTFFLHALKRMGGCRILQLKSLDALVHTRGQVTLYDFWHQRLRWASKSRHYRDADTLYTAVLVFSLNLCILLSWACIFFFRNYWLIILMITGKAVFDYLLIRSYLRFLGKKLPLLQFAFISLLYPFYVVSVAVSSQFIRYAWKGRDKAYMR